MYKIEKKEKDKVEILVSENQADWDALIDKVYQKEKTKYNVMGFRKGHAPRKVIEQIYGEGIFFEDAFNNMIDENLLKFTIENPLLEPVSNPDIHIQSISKDGIKVMVSFDIVPDFEVGKHEGLKIKVHKFETTDGEVDAEINQELEQHAKFVDVDRPVQNSDRVIIDFAGFVDGVQFDGGTAENYPLDIGSHTFIDNFEEQLVGANKGDKVDVHVTFPKDYGKEDMAGKKATFEVTIKAIKEKLLPALDDKYVSDTTEFETVEEYRKHLKEHIDIMKQNNQEAEYEHALTSAIIENTKIDLPEEYLDYIKKASENNVRATANAYRIDMKTFVMLNGCKTEEELFERSYENSISSVKRKYILRKLIEKYNISIPEDFYKKQTEYLYKQQDKNDVVNKYLNDAVMKILKEKNTKVPADDKEFGE